MTGFFVTLQNILYCCFFLPFATVHTHMYVFLCSHYNAITLYAVYMGCVFGRHKKIVFFYVSVTLGQVVNRHLTNTHKK